MIAGEITKYLLVLSILKLEISKIKNLNLKFRRTNKQYNISMDKISKRIMLSSK